MPENAMLAEAIAALRNGQRHRARDLLTRLLHQDQGNPEYWLWMSAAVDTPKEQVFCLQSVWRLDPGNAAARQGLALLGAMPEQVKAAGGSPAQPIRAGGTGVGAANVGAAPRRNWEASLPSVGKPGGLAVALRHPAKSMLAIAALLLVMVTSLLLGVGGLGRRTPAIAKRPARTLDLVSTFTPTPTRIIRNTPTPVPPTATMPVFFGDMPLAQRLEATYTPTPIYVATAHPVNEAFRSGQRLLAQGDWKAALDFFRQASEVDPQAADIQYLVGEILLQLGDPLPARQAFEKALAINPNFGPAYLSHAHALLAANPAAEVRPDLDLAILNDPNYALAYVERGAYWIAAGDFGAAASDLDMATGLDPNNPVLYLYRSIVEQRLGAGEAALADARKAITLDITLLPAYLQLGQVALEASEADEAVRALEIYTTFAGGSPQAWLALAEAYQLAGRHGAAVLAAGKVLSLDEQNSQAYLLRGQASLELGNLESALDDLVNASRLEPGSFASSLALACARAAAGQAGEAKTAFNRSLKLAQSDSENAQVYYWRAQMYTTAGNATAAAKDWQALLALPVEAFPPEWRTIAVDRLTPTPAATLPVSPEK